MRRGPPVTRFASSGDVSIAYQVVGDGPFDLVYVPGAMSHVDGNWDNPARARYFRALSSGCRLILFDKRGTGASDAVGIANLETRIDDVRAVMDAAGSSRAAVMGVSEGGPMSVLFAALHPERVAALILYGSLPRFLWAPDFPWGQVREEWDREIEHDARDGERSSRRGSGCRESRTRRPNLSPEACGWEAVRTPVARSSG